MPDLMNVPDLKNRVLEFLTLNAGFENAPLVDVVHFTEGFKVQYTNFSGNIIAFGEDAVNAFNDFIDKWERFRSRSYQRD